MFRPYIFELVECSRNACRRRLASMLLGHGYSLVRQQVLNKDIEYKPYAKAQLKTFLWNRDG
jgi:hypothetical protein